MYCTDKYSQESLIIWPVGLNDWVLVHKLSGYGLKSSHWLEYFEIGIVGTVLILINQGIWSSHLTLCLTLISVFGYCSRTFPDLKITVYIFCSDLLVTWPWCHRWRIFAPKNLLNLVLNGKRIFCWSIFSVQPITDFCPFLLVLTFKESLRDHGINGEFVSLANRIVLCIIWKKNLCWSIIAIEPIATFSLFWGY